MAADLFKFVLSHPALGPQEIQAPNGWEDMQHTIARDALYHGVTISYTLDFNFVKDGREYLQAIYTNFGIEAEILLLVFEWDANQHLYNEAYQGLINLSKYKITEIDASSNSEMTGFAVRLLNLEDVEVDLTKLTSVDGLPIAKFDTEFQELLLHSKATIKSYEGNSSIAQPEYDFRLATTEDETSGTIYIGWDNETLNEFNAYSYPTGINFSKEGNPLIEFAETGTVEVEYSLNFHIQCYAAKGDFKSSEVDFFIGTSLNGTPVNENKVPTKRLFGKNQDHLSGFFSEEVVISGKETYNIKEGDGLYFFGYTGVFDTSSPLIGTFQFEWQIELKGANYIKVKAVTKTAATTAKGMLIHEAYTRVIQSITGRNNAFYSELLGRTDSAITKYSSDGDLSNLWLSNGSQIRGFPMVDTVFTAPAWSATKTYYVGNQVSLSGDNKTYTATATNTNQNPSLLTSWSAVSTPTAVSGRPIFASLKQLFNSTSAIQPIGQTIEKTAAGERVRVEGLDFFYSKDIILELGQASGLELSVAQEYYYNSIEFGYKKWASNEQNSLDEVNTKQTRLTPITRLKSSYTFVSDYVASGYLIESVRRQQYSLGPEKESSDDKTNFWVCVLRKIGGGFETERNQKLVVCENVLDPDSIYNFRITPLRNFLRHDKVVKASVKYLESKNIAFNEGNANYIAKTQFSGEAKAVVENMPITGNDLRPALWIPEYYEFTAPLRTFQRKKIEENPYGKIQFLDSLGNKHFGYIKEIKASIVAGSATFKLLRAPN